MAEERRGEKLRLNITVDEDIVKRAKDMGFNISAGFEEYLRIFTSKPQGSTNEDVVKAYDSLLQRMEPILEKYNTMVEVGEVTRKNHIQTTKGGIDYYGCKLFFDHGVSILKDGKYYMDAGPVIHHDLYFEPRDVDFFYEPKKILENLVNAIRKAAGENNSKVQKLNLASKFVQALFSDIENSSESGIETPLFRQILADAGVKPAKEDTNSHLEEENKEILA